MSELTEPLPTFYELQDANSELGLENDELRRLIEDVFAHIAQKFPSTYRDSPAIRELRERYGAMSKKEQAGGQPWIHP